MQLRNGFSIKQASKYKEGKNPADRRVIEGQRAR